MVEEIKKMSEKEVVRVVNEMYDEVGKYDVSNTLKDAREIGKFPKRLTGI